MYAFNLHPKAHIRKPKPLIPQNPMNWQLFSLGLQFSQELHSARHGQHAFERAALKPKNPKTAPASLNILASSMLITTTHVVLIVAIIVNSGIFIYQGSSSQAAIACSISHEL